MIADAPQGGVRRARAGRAGDAPWHPGDAKLCMLVSGAYHVGDLVHHLDCRGLYRRIFLSIMEAGLTGVLHAVLLCWSRATYTCMDC